ncbi:hypothetical protein SUDANB23_06778 (plasmid) [Streptomyces sp. enrichment culture]
MTSPSLFLVRAVHRPPASPSASSTPTPRRGARQHVLPDEPLQPHKVGPLTPPHRHAPTTPGPLCPPRASLTAVTPSSSRPRTAPPEAGVMPPSSTTSHCPPQRPPRPTRSSASLAGTPCASRRANNLQPDVHPTVWYCVPAHRIAAQCGIRSGRFVGTVHCGRSSRNSEEALGWLGVSRIFANVTCCINLMHAVHWNPHERATPARPTPLPRNSRAGTASRPVGRALDRHDSTQCDRCRTGPGRQAGRASVAQMDVPGRVARPDPNDHLQAVPARLLQKTTLRAA